MNKNKDKMSLKDQATLFQTQIFLMLNNSPNLQNLQLTPQNNRLKSLISMTSVGKNQINQAKNQRVIIFSIHSSYQISKRRVWKMQDFPILISTKKNQSYLSQNPQSKIHLRDLKNLPNHRKANQMITNRCLIGRNLEKGSMIRITMLNLNSQSMSQVNLENLKPKSSFLKKKSMLSTRIISGGPKSQKNKKANKSISHISKTKDRITQVRTSIQFHNKSITEVPNSMTSTRNNNHKKSFNKEYLHQ